MSVDGFWTIIYQAPGTTNGAVILLNKGTILGGDSSFFYSGAYNEKDGNFNGNITAVHYHGSKITAAGTSEDQFDLAISGVVEGDTMTCIVSSPDQSTSMKVKGVRRG